MIRKDVDIVTFLLEHKVTELNIRKVAKGLNLDYKSIHTIISRLQTMNVVTLTEFGKTKRIDLISTVHPLIYEAEHKRQKNMQKDKNITTIINYFKSNLKTKFYVLLLFGSYAKKTNTKNSDIDLLFIIPSKEMEKEIHRTASMLPLPLHLNIFTEKEFQAMKNSREPTVVSEALKQNIILHGIELYYSL